MKVLKENIYTGIKCRASAFKIIKRFGFISGSGYDYIKMEKVFLIKINENEFVEANELLDKNLPKSLALKVCKHYPIQPSKKGDIFIQNAKPYYKHFEEAEKVELSEITTNTDLEA